MVRAILAASLVALLALSLAPAAEAARLPVLGDGGDCVVGNDVDDCLVAFYYVVCVTEPCDGLKLCVAYGRVCLL